MNTFPSRKSALVRKYKAWVLLLILGIPIQSSATTVVIFVTRFGIVMGTDSKHVINAAHIFRGDGGTSDKAVIIQDHIAIASIGHLRISYGPMQYDFLDWIKDVESRLPKNISVEEFESVIEAESMNNFAVFNTILDQGLMTQNDTMQNCESFVQYVIAGYRDNQPKVYAITFEVDWSTRKLVGPTKTILSDTFAGDAHLLFFGVREALGDLHNPTSFGYEQALVNSPKGFGNLIAHRAVTLDGSISLIRALIKIEEKTNPGTVGGDIRLIEILPNGGANRVVNEKTLPKVGLAGRTHNNSDQQKSPSRRK